MSLIKEFYLSFLVLLVLLVLSSEAAESVTTQTLSNVTLNGTGTITSTASTSNLTLDIHRNLVHNAFAKMDRGTVMRGAIVLGGIAGLMLMYAGIKAALLRKKNQPRKYTLIDNLTAMEEPLVGAENRDDDEAEDDTIFARK